jgi:membrane-bound lytic murein transglycosylase B
MPTHGDTIRPNLTPFSPLTIKTLTSKPENSFTQHTLSLTMLHPRTLPPFIPFFLLLFLPHLALAQNLPPVPEHQQFISYLQTLKQPFLSQGVSPLIFDSFISSVSYRQGVIESDRNQPESKFTPQKYLSYLVSEKRIEKGKLLLKKHQKLLQKISDTFGVPPHVLVAFWGIESFYGTYTGKVPISHALATLTFDTRRRQFFKEQLFSYLLLRSEGSLTHDNIGSSWAGAMGHMQFMPSTYLQYAIDYDNDKKRDLWESLPDIFASAAHYLQKVGWKKGQRWGRPVSLPSTLKPENYKKTLPLNQWKKIGLRLWDGNQLPTSTIKAKLIFFDNNAPAFISYHNFNVILRWNRSTLYALAVGLLSDHIADKKTPSNFAAPFTP